MAWGKSGYGQRGGTSINAGRTANVYEVTFPDGTKAKTRVFTVDSSEAVAMCYQRDGVWRCTAILAQAEDWPAQIPVPARRVS